jgi:NADH-quinone oxidoreductase subunit A
VQRRDLEELVNAYVAPLVLLLALLACIALVYLVSLWLAPTRRVLCAEPFMAGHDPREHAFGRFHARWYAVCLLFLAFDMEMVFVYPWAVVFAQTGFKALVEIGLFLLILVIGVLYAWREGACDGPDRRTARVRIPPAARAGTGRRGCHSATARSRAMAADARLADRGYPC